MQDETSYYPLTEISINNNGNTISYVFTPLDINEFQLKEPLLNHLNTYNEPPSESFGLWKSHQFLKLILLDQYFMDSYLYVWCCNNSIYIFLN